MRVGLNEVLAMASFRAARTTVVTGDPESTTVRWVHSSEVYEMGPLLAGGEVLLTSGLGLHGRGASHLSLYVEQIADAGAVAIGIELGRTFLEVPEPMVEAAQRRGLCLLTFHRVVPFERMVEDFHELLMRRKASAGRADAELRHLLHVVVDGLGLRALLDEVSRAAGCVVELRDTDGQTVERSRIASVTGDGEVVAHVRGPEGVVGAVHLLGRPTRARERVAELASVAVGLELGRGAVGPRPGPAQSLVSDLAGGVLVSATEARRRLEDLGWPDADARHVLVMAVEVDSRVPLVDAVPAVERDLAIGTGAVLAGVVGSQVVALVRGWARPVPWQVREELSAAAGRLAGDVSGPFGAAPLVGVATPVHDLSLLGAAVQQARGITRTARRFGLREGVVMARDVAAQHLLAEVIDPGVLAEFVTEQIGPLIDHDRRHRTELLRTLDAYLVTAQSKAPTARLLGIRRQSLYDRLVQIERLLGVSLGEPGHRSGLALALLGWRMRTGLDPQVGFGGD